MTSLPFVSFVIATYNGIGTIRDCLESVFSQDYPRSRFEVITVDGGSSDGTRDVIKEYPVVFIHNKHRLSEGPGMGKEQGGKKAKGDIIIYVDQDNILTSNDWLKLMIEPFQQNSEVAVVQSPLAVVKGDSLFNQYLSLIGLEDPFAIDRALTSKFVFTPWFFEDKGSYYLYVPKTENLCYGGNNGCAYRRKEFLEIGGYTRDNDMFCLLAEIGAHIAIPKKPSLHHKTSTGFFHFMKKRGHYYKTSTLDNVEGRHFPWIVKSFKGYLHFFSKVLCNLLLIPNFIVALWMMFRKPHLLWLLHPFILFVITVEYIFLSISSPSMLKNALRRIFTKVETETPGGKV